MKIPFLHKDVDSHSFDDILKGFQHAVNSAQELLMAQQLDLLGRYFDPSGQPVMKTIRIAPDKAVNIPVLSLVPQNTLAISEVEIEFTTKVKNVTSNNLLGGIGAQPQDVSHAAMEVNISPVNDKDTSLVHVTVKFKTVPQPENVSRIIDEQNKFL